MRFFPKSKFSLTYDLYEPIFQRFFFRYTIQKNPIVHHLLEIFFDIPVLISLPLWIPNSPVFPLRYRLSFRCLRFWFLIILIQDQQFPCESFLFLRVSFSNDTFKIINFSIFQFFFTYLHKSFFEIISCLVPKGFVSYHHRGSGYNY